MGSRRNWQRNYSIEMILSKRQPPWPNSVVVVLDHLKGGYNAAKIVRSASAFGCQEVHFVNVPIFDPAPAKGCLRQTFTKTFTNMDDSFADLKGQGFTVYALDSRAERCLGDFTLPERTAFVVGHEEYGLSFSPEALGVEKIKIRQFGKVESLNVSIAASMACYEYTRQQTVKRLFEKSIRNMSDHALSISSQSEFGL